jgi:hypothetical protein
MMANFSPWPLTLSSRQTSLNLTADSATKCSKLTACRLPSTKNLCLFIPVNFGKITLKIFREMLLTVGYYCPKCGEHFNKLKLHSKICFSKVIAFSSFVPLIELPLANGNLAKLKSSEYDISLL